MIIMRGIMINSQKTRLMTKCTIYENNQGREDIGMSKYFQADYVRLNIVKTIVSVTLGYLAVLGLYFLYKFDFFMEQAFKIDYKAFGLKLLGFYIALLAIYISVCWITYSAKYRKSRARLSKYYKLLGKINKLNEKDERIKDLEEF